MPIKSKELRPIPPKKVRLLSEGDVIELREGHKVYADIPEHFVYANRQGSFKLTHHEATISEQLIYLAGRYVVVKTTSDGGGTGMGPYDVYPNGHHVYAERADGTKVDFYQSGCFTAMIENISPVGSATRKWTEE